MTSIKKSDMKNIEFDCPYTKEEAVEAIKRLVEYFKNDKKDEDYFGLDDLGVIDIYLNWSN